MEIRNPVHPEDFKTYDTQRIREEFLIQGLFSPGQVRWIYSHFDRMIIGGICPTNPVRLETGKEIGADFFLQRRELGVINVGPKGKVTVDGQEFPHGPEAGCRGRPGEPSGRDLSLQTL